MLPCNIKNVTQINSDKNLVDNVIFILQTI